MKKRKEESASGPLEPENAGAPLLAEPAAEAAPSGELSPAEEVRATGSLIAFADWVTNRQEQAKDAEKIDPETSYVSFFLDREEYGLPIENVREILRVDEITRVPQAPPHIRGVTNVRGKILPVVEIRTRIGLTPLVPTPASRIVVLEVAGRTLGLLVDREARVAKVKKSQIEVPPEEIVSARTDYVRAVAKQPGGLLFLLDPEKTLVVRDYVAKD
ncbi:MAG: chemotaxis protein CheW [Thermoanaerobaculia bacterium]